MNREKQLSIINITKRNVDIFWPSLQFAIKGCSFIALDCELSGLGNRKHHKESEIDDRYKLLCAIAKSHSIIAFGISCFTCKSVSKLEDEKSGSIKSHNYLVQTFNILTLCVNNYEIEYDAMKFLLSHGFDFNKQYKEGLPYYKGDDVKNHKEPAVLAEHSVRNIFKSIVENGKPIVLHNGFIDLLFLYENFYAALPENIGTYTADLSSMFPKGIYDTKYIVDTESLPASYLPYVFNKLLLANRSREKKGQWHVNIRFPPYPIDLMGLSCFHYRQILQYKPVKNKEGLCEGFKLSGWCAKGDKCSLSHNIYEIVHNLSSVGRGKRYINSSQFPTCEIIARMKQNEKRNNLLEKSPENRFYSADPSFESLNEFDYEIITDDQDTKEPTAQACHTAGYDAFMTGFAFATCVSILGSICPTETQFVKSIDMEIFINRLFYVGKSYPFIINHSYFPISKSHFIKSSTAKS